MIDPNPIPKATLTEEWFLALRRRRRYHQIAAVTLFASVLLCILAYGTRGSLDVVLRTKSDEWRGSLSYFAGVLTGIALAWGREAWNKSRGLS